MPDPQPPDDTTSAKGGILAKFNTALLTALTGLTVWQQVELTNYRKENSDFTGKLLEYALGAQTAAAEAKKAAEKTAKTATSTQMTVESVEKGVAEARADQKAIKATVGEVKKSIAEIQ